jgi:hypothetical protein
MVASKKAHAIAAAARAITGASTGGDILQPTDPKSPSPSLRGGGHAQADSRRILANLEQESEGAGATRQRRFARPSLSSAAMLRAGAAAALLLALAFAGWWTWHTAVTPGSRPAPPIAMAAVAPVTAQRPPAPVAAPEAPAAPSTGPAAAIVNETPPAEHAAAGAPPFHPAHPATVEWPATTAVAAATRAAKDKPADKAIAHGDAAGPRAKPVPAPAATADSDVQLLTALVAHANGLPPDKAAPSRDVVQRKDGDSTANLLQRCKALGPIEGMLCRSRICSGRWDEDAACSK